MPPIDVVFLSTAWGPRWGGVNAFNRDLAVALAEFLRPLPRLRVACVVPSSAMEAREIDGVEILSLGRDSARGELPTEDAQAIVELLARHAFAGSILVGHDLHTGPVALAVRDLLNAQAGASQVAVIVHTKPSAYKWLEGGDPEQIERKVERQREIVRSADMVFAVGPKLYRAARDLLRQRIHDSQPRREPLMLIPGLAEIQPYVDSPEQFRAITFGRLDPRADRVKQGRLALAGFAGVIAARYGDLGDDPQFTLVGADDADVADIRRLAAEQARRPIAVYARPFSEDRAQLWNLLSNQSVSLMLSIHEGFGLTGWEAIAAGVPLIVSQNTGLYELLKTHEKLGGKALGCVSAVDVHGSLDEDSFNERDLAAVGECLAQIARSPDGTKRDALNLRHLCLDAGLTWKATAKIFAQGCGLEVPEPAGRRALVLNRWKVVAEEEALHAQLSIRGVTPADLRRLSCEALAIVAQTAVHRALDLPFKDSVDTAFAAIVRRIASCDPDKENRRTTQSINTVMAQERRILVAAPGGCGKTVTAIALARRLLTDEDLPVPIYIPLRTFTSSESIHNFIESHYGLSLKRLTSSYNVAVILDDWHTFHTPFGTISDDATHVMLQCSDARLIAFSRPTSPDIRFSNWELVS